MIKIKNDAQKLAQHRLTTQPDWRGLAIVLLFCLLNFCLLNTRANAQQTNSTQLVNREVVVLKNGSTMQGEVATEVDKLVIRLATGIELRIAFDQVRFRASDLDEAYLILASELTQGDAREHIKLADWCLEQQLYAQFEYQLGLAGRFGASADLIERKKRLLSIKLQQKENNYPVQQTGATEPVESAKVAGDQVSEMGTTAPNNSPIESDTEDELAWFSQQLEIRFQQEIQPRLVHGCSAGGCHGPGDERGFQLQRTARGMRLNRLQTTANLESTFRALDWEDAAQSPLLQWAKVTHGNANHPPYLENSKHFQEIEAWVVAVVEAKGLRGEQMNATDAGAPISRIDREQILRIDSPTEQEKDPANAGQGMTGLSTNEQANSTTMGVGEQTEQRRLIVSPLDPELFNRLMHPDRFAPVKPKRQTAQLPSSNAEIPLPPATKNLPVVGTPDPLIQSPGNVGK